MGSPGAHFGSKLGSTKGLTLVSLLPYKNNHSPDIVDMVS